MSSLIIKFSVLLEHLMLMGRNSRWPNKANHGSRPCSSVMRRMRRDGFYRRPREEGNAGIEIPTDDDKDGGGDDDEDEEEEGATKTADTGTPDAGATKEGDKTAGKDQKTQGKDAKSAGKDTKTEKKPETGKAKGK